MTLDQVCHSINQRYHSDYGDPIWCDHITASHCWDQGSNELIVSVGESWTNYFGTQDINRQEFWGLDLALHRGADWLNIASPGFSNHWMLHNLLNFSGPIMALPYQKIQVIICLTEMGRELDDYKVFDYDFRGELALELQEQGPRYVLQYQAHKLQDLLHKMVAAYSPRAQVTVAANFSDVLVRLRDYEPLQAHCLSHSWVEILAQELSLAPPPQIPVMFDQTIEKYRRFLLDPELFNLDSAPVHKWLLTLLEDSNLMLDWFRICPTVRRDSGKHPDQAGRDIWVKYLLQRLYN